MIFIKLQKLWNRFEEILGLEYESKVYEKIASIVLERSKQFSKGKSMGYTQDEIEKMFGVS